MFPRSSLMLSASTFLLWSLIFGAAHAAVDSNARAGRRNIEKTVNLRTHSIYAPYIDEDLQNRWWDFGADAYINTNKHVRLTRHKPSQMGWLWSRLVLTPPNFVVETEFKISGSSTHLFGDGMALWLTTERAQPGPVFGNKDKFTGLGVIIDTYANTQHSYGMPRISGFLGDGSMSYDFGNDGDGQAIGACTANVRRTNVATKLKLTYVKGQYLDVKLQYRAWDEWTDCFYVENVTLPSNVYIGFSAMTGDVSDAHDIISVTTSSAILGPDESAFAAQKKPSIWRPSSSSSERSWFGTLFKLFIFAGIVAAGFYGFKEYKRRQMYGGYGANHGMQAAGFGTNPRVGPYGPNIFADAKRF